MNAILATFLLATTLLTFPQDVRWMPLIRKGVPKGATYAVLAGKGSCDVLYRYRFPDGFVFPWHVNNTYGIYTVLKGTLVIGFDKGHARSAERSLPAGSVMEGLDAEWHYGRAVGETIYDVFKPCR
jgi:hypothetical protein